MRFQKDTAPVIEPKDMFVGPPDAPVTLTEFGDYESEACYQAQAVVQAVLEAYPDNVKFVFRHFPLTRIHQKAHKAAEAAIAAGQEGKFWPMHQELFANRRNLGVISLKSYAREAGVTNKRFLDDLMNGVYGWNVQGDLREGLEKGIRDIPVFYVNDREVKGGANFESISQLIEEALVSERPHKKRRAA